MDLLIQPKRCFDFLFQILILAIFFTIHVMDVTIVYLTCTEYVKLHPQQFLALHFTVYSILFNIFTGTVFIIISGFQIIAELT